MDGERQSIRILISGRVQGVGYRAWCVRKASALGLSGWVRNLPYGPVEAVLCGPPGAVAAMLAAVRRGPVAARVDDVRIVGEAPAAHGSFAVRTTPPS
ncbi:acylphosphatase [Polymorphum gilvum]|uniref:acylphosphatase n=1 Tax=Polymorphum gilvum (strain LMG 25793 / CGMCC 1.9160 / SL003B-26A1) TaxID=991905 RepID=F2IUY8_POLGS|nr:acylphosphatase [Polymorphum gilvum]ADZ70217.1 Acylphosphatase, putative [Polymorphum gilvum SL003B-26A1]